MKIITFIKKQENRVILFTLMISTYLILKSFLMSITSDDLFIFKFCIRR